MNRTITVSTDVYAAIWAKRELGEETEDSILRRVFGCKDAPPPAFTPKEQESHISGASNGVYDTRNGVHFPEGTRIFRTYKGREYAATASNGRWQREDIGRYYLTVNQLNESIAAGRENVWNNNWKYRAEDGSTRSINTLRGGSYA